MDAARWAVAVALDFDASAIARALSLATEVVDMVRPPIRLAIQCLLPYLVFLL